MFLCLWQDIANDGYGPFAVTVYLIVMAAVVGILRQHFLTAAVCRFDRNDRLPVPVGVDQNGKKGVEAGRAHHPANTSFF